MMWAISLVFVGAAGQSMKDCGQTSDHWKFSELSVTPDPPVPGQNVTMVMAGKLDKDITSGTIALGIKAGIISLPAVDVPFANSPGTHGGNHKVTIGPFKYPNVNIPLIKTIQVNMLIKDDKGEQVACMESAFPALGKEEVTASADPVTNCGKPSDHLKNLKITLDPPAPVKGQSLTTTMAGDLDEDISSGVASVNIDLAIVKLGLDIPFSISPAMPKVTGMTASIGPLSLPNIPLIPNVKGSVKVTEQKGDEVMCLSFNMPVKDAATVVV